MNAETRSQQATRILRALAAMPGSRSLNVTSRKFSRLGPAEPGTSYEECTRSFRADGIPMKRLSIPSDVEEVVITLQGALPTLCNRDRVLRELRQTIGELQDTWEARARFARSSDAPAYEVTVFTDVHGAEPEQVA